MSLKELKEKVLADNSLNLSVKDTLGVVLCDNKEYIYKVLKTSVA